MLFRSAAQALQVEIPDFAAPRSITLGPIGESQGSLEKAEAMNLKRIGLGVIGAPDCDGFGRMRTERSEERRVGKECRSRWSRHH